MTPIVLPLVHSETGLAPHGLMSCEYEQLLCSYLSLRGVAIIGSRQRP